MGLGLFLFKKTLVYCNFYSTAPEGFVQVRASSHTKNNRSSTIYAQTCTNPFGAVLYVDPYRNLRHDTIQPGIARCLYIRACW